MFKLKGVWGYRACLHTILSSDSFTDRAECTVHLASTFPHCPLRVDKWYHFSWLNLPPTAIIWCHIWDWIYSGQIVFLVKWPKYTTIITRFYLRAGLCLIWWLGLYFAYVINVDKDAFLGNYVFKMNLHSALKGDNMQKCLQNKGIKFKGTLMK